MINVTASGDRKRATPHNTSWSESTAMLESTVSLDRFLRVDVLILLLIFYFLSFARIADFSLSIDDEFAAVRISPDVWILQGRWCAYLIERLLVPNSVVPFFPMAMFGLGMALSYRALLTSVGVKTLRPVHYLAFPMYATFPTWLFLTAFASNVIAAAAGHLLAVYAAIVFSRTTHGQTLTRLTVLRLAAAAACLGLAMGFYQAFAFSFLTVAWGLLTVGLLRAPMSLRDLAGWLVRMAIVAAASFAVYKLGDWIAHRASGVNSSSYLDVFADWRGLFERPLSTLKASVTSVSHVYGGDADIYGYRIVGLPIVLALGFSAIAFTTLPLQRKSVVLLAALITGACPFLLELTSNGSIPTRTMVAVPCAIWFIATLALTIGSRPVAMGAAAAVILTVLQMTYAVNLMQAANQLSRVHDELLAAELYSRIALVNADVGSPTTFKVDFYGAKEFPSLFPRPPASTLGSSFFAWDGGNQARILNYMRIIGYDNLASPSDEERRADLPLFSEMPAWPAAGSVRVVGGITLVKLGPKPGYPFNVP